MVECIANRTTRAPAASAPCAGAGEDHHFVLGDAIEQRVRLLVEEVPVDAFGAEAGHARFPAQVFNPQSGELAFELDDVGVEFSLALSPCSPFEAPETR